jgi:hypothetical protein
MKLASLCLVFAGCATNADPDLPLGAGTYELDGVPLGIEAVWAEPGYSPISDTDSVGAYAIKFAANGASASCSETRALDTLEQIDITTTQPYDASFGGGLPSLSPGVIPVVALGTVGSPPAQPVAAFELVYPDMSDGTLTITAFDDTTITGTFAAHGSDLVESGRVKGSFTATICPAQ